MKKVIRNRIGELLAVKERTEGRDITYSDLGAVIGASRQTAMRHVKNLSGSIDYDVILKLVNFFEITDMNDLFVIEEEE